LASAAEPHHSLRVTTSRYALKPAVMAEDWAAAKAAAAASDPVQETASSAARAQAAESAAGSETWALGLDSADRRLALE
jgi:hypothetical protein